MTNLIMQVEHILPLKQDGSESMKREVDEPLGSRKWLAVTNDGSTDHRHCRNIEIGRPIFNRKDNFSVQTKKSIYSAPEHARTI